MKNVKVFLVGLVAALAVSASASVQPIVPGQEANPFRINAGVGAGMGAYRTGSTNGFGLSRMGAGLGFGHYVGHDFQYNVGLGGSWASLDGHRLFGDKLSGADYKAEGFRFDAMVGANYLPRITENLNVGGLVNVGYGRMFGRAASERTYKNYSFGDLSFAVGPALNYQFGAGSVYTALTYGVGSMRFGGKNHTTNDKAMAFRHAVELPIGGLFNVNDNTGVFVEVAPKWSGIKGHKFHHGIGVCAAAGVSFTM